MSPGGSQERPLDPNRAPFGPPWDPNMRFFSFMSIYVESESLKESSNYWNKLAIQNLEQINRLGIKKFHSSVLLLSLLFAS